MPTVYLGDQCVSYTVKQRPRRKYPALRIAGPLGVEVLIPPDFDPVLAESLIRMKAEWVLKHLADRPRDTAASRLFVPGELYGVLGEPHALEVGNDASGGVRVTQARGRLVVTFPAEQTERDSAVIRRALTLWYRDMAKTVLPERVRHYVPKIGVQPAQLKIYEYKTRWGYCRDDGLIALNWRIVQAPITVVDYVVAHELTHRIYPHHQAQFWHALETVCPAYESQKSWLREHGRELIW